MDCKADYMNLCLMTQSLEGLVLTSFINIDFDFWLWDSMTQSLEVPVLMRYINSYFVIRSLGGAELTRCIDTSSGDKGQGRLWGQGDMLQDAGHLQGGQLTPFLLPWEAQENPKRQIVKVMYEVHSKSNRKV
jgi:hypothetical protein